MDRRKSKINIIKHNRKLINPVCRIGIAYRAFLLGALFYYNREKTQPILRIPSYLFHYRSYTIVSQGKEVVNAMTARERILSLKLLEKQEQNPEYARRIGIQVKMMQKDPKKMEDKNV